MHARGVALAAVLLASSFGGGCLAGDVPERPRASANVVDLDEFTFYPAVADGRVWFVEFFVPWCRSCKRLSDMWMDLADSLADGGQAHIAVGRFDCERAEELCDKLGVTRTPTLKVFYQGADVETYKADYLHIDMFRPFILRMAKELKAGAAGGGGAAGTADEGRAGEQALDTEGVA